VHELLRSHLAIGNIRRQVLAPFDRFDYLLTPTIAVSP
jgi:hypothetical protein